MAVSLETLALAKKFTTGAVSGLLDVGVFSTDADGNLMMEVDSETVKDFRINDNGELEVTV